MHQVGLIHKWTGDYWPKKDRCSYSAKANAVKNHTVNLNDMQGSFFVLFMGESIQYSHLDSSIVLLLSHMTV